MEHDIFSNEQSIFDKAQEAINNDAPLGKEAYAKLTKQYGRLLRLLRRSTSLSDKTTHVLNENNINLEDKVHYDSLTEIYNRRYLDNSLPRIIQTLSRARGELSVIMLDIDYFKKYNDTYGHAQGDVCLKRVAAQLEASLTRASDFVARYGGEEFIVILPNTNENGAKRIADRILGNVVKENILHTSSEAAPNVTLSAGVTTGYVNHKQTPGCYIECADRALYMSKKDGRARYTFLPLEAEKE